VSLPPLDGRIPLTSAAQEVVDLYGTRTGLVGLPVEVKERADERTLVLQIASPVERHYRAANEIGASLRADHPYAGRVAVKPRRSGRVTLADPESRLLQQLLAGSATSDRHSFQGDLADLYIPTGSGAESRITADGNHLVFGRRGAGKSSLLVYALRLFERQGRPSAWVDMQTFEHRADTKVVVDVLLEIVRQLDEVSRSGMASTLLSRLKALRQLPNDPAIEEIRKLAPDIKQLFAPVTQRYGRFAIFLDDLHVIAESLQPVLLGILYSFARGNKVDLKASSLEHFTRHWDPGLRLGLEVPGDAQTIPLDYNLTNPGNALRHIKSILDAYAQFSGLRSILTICGPAVIERLVWLAAGVPRDALSVLQQAMSSAAGDGRKQVGVTDVNIAASTYVEDKNRYLGMDTSDGQDRVRILLEAIKEFCIKEKRINAFLVRIGSEKGPYRDILRLIDLRFLHVLNRGLTPGEAAEKYVALLLDYGFYTGVRRAKTVDVLQKTPGKLRVDTLRKLPRFDPAAALARATAG
jgi:hypothetical protein